MPTPAKQLQLTLNLQAWRCCQLAVQVKRLTVITQRQVEQCTARTEQAAEQLWHPKHAVYRPKQCALAPARAVCCRRWTVYRDKQQHSRQRIAGIRLLQLHWRAEHRGTTATGPFESLAPTAFAEQIEAQHPQVHLLGRGNIGHHQVVLASARREHPFCGLLAR